MKSVELPPTLEQYVKKILTSRVYDIAVKMPLQPARQLSEHLGNQVLLKHEDLQPVFSFKIRGTYNEAAQLTEKERARGVIAASTGNHAQSLALAAKRQGIRAIIVMPKTIPEIEVQAVRTHGAETVLYGDAFPKALTHALRLVDKKGYIFVYPYDDPDTIADQGTMVVRALRRQPDRLDAIFVPVGGGRLVAGIAAYVECLRPEVKVIGVELDKSNCLQAAMAAGERVVLGQIELFIDGVAMAQIGQHAFDICKDHVDEVTTVSIDEICAVIKDIYDSTRSITEPAGALAVTGIKKYVECEHTKGQTPVAIGSGANVNFDRLRHITGHAELGERRETIIAVTIPEQPDSFKAFCEAIGKHQITELSYRYHSGSEAHIFVGVQTHSENDPREALAAYLREKGFSVFDLTDNELAKLHIHHMIGGHTVKVGDETVFHFEFSGWSGALLNFLTRLGGRWNISMFHYRNHGAAGGRVVAGLQVPEDERHPIPQTLEAIGYPYWDETANPAYQLFLS